MGRAEENAGFVCTSCRRMVEPLTNWSYRNHRLHCLRSRHVDVSPGDRRNGCGGPMDPVAIRTCSNGYQIAHRCRKCGVIRWNRLAERTRQPDDVGELVRLLSDGSAVV